MNKRSIGAFLAVTPLLAAAVYCPPNRTKASAAPAFHEPEGADVFETVPLDLNGLRVEKEVVTLDIPHFPELDGLSLSQKEYKARITTEYLLCNPTQEDITARFVYPLGTCAEYLQPYRDISLYSVKAAGNELKSTLRHCFVEGKPSNLEECISKLESSTQGFYSNSLPVTEYLCTVALPSLGSETNWLRITCSYNTQKTHIYAPDCYTSNIVNGNTVISFRIGEVTETFRFFVIGDSIPLSASVEQGYIWKNKDRVPVEGASADLQEINTHNLESFLAELKCCQEINDSDWFRCASDYLEYICNDYGILGCIPETLENDLFRWLEYSLTVPAGETIAHSVSGPVYPTITSGKGYIYRYKLSPAQKWCEHGGIDIRINTPYEISDSTLEFEKEEETYTFSRASLPMGELTFMLSEGCAGKTPYVPYDDETPALTTAFIMLAIIITIAVVSITAIIIRNKRMKKLLSESHKQIGRTEEGKIDIDTKKKQ